MIGAKMGLKAVSSIAKWRGYHARIVNNHVERFPFRQQLISASPHTLKVGKIEPDQLECATIVCSVLSHLRSGVFSFGKIPRRAHNVCATCPPATAPFPRRARPKHPLRGPVCPSDSRRTRRPLWSKLSPNEVASSIFVIPFLLVLTRSM